WFRDLSGRSSLLLRTDRKNWRGDGRRGPTIRGGLADLPKAKNPLGIAARQLEIIRSRRFEVMLGACAADRPACHDYADGRPVQPRGFAGHQDGLAPLARQQALAQRQWQRAEQRKSRSQFGVAARLGKLENRRFTEVSRGP